MRTMQLFFLIILFSSLSVNAQTWTDEGCYDISWYDESKKNEIDAYTISTPQQLAGLAYLVNNKKEMFLHKTFYLDTDIDLDGKRWISIGLNNGADVFGGILDGKGHTIKNMHIEENIVGGDNHPTSYCFGLFGYSYGGMKFSDVHIGEGSYIHIKQVPYTVEDGISKYYTLYSCLIGSIVAGGAGRIPINGCSSKADIDVSLVQYGRLDLGGIIGAGNVSDCLNSGNITVSAINTIPGQSGYFYTGGVVGYGNASQSTNYGEIESTGHGHIGGIAGFSDIADYCTNYNNVSGKSFDWSNICIGGICGACNAMINCSNLADLKGESHDSPNAGYTTGIYIGGTCGNAETIYNSYNSGNIAISGSNSVASIGGIAGNFYDQDVTLYNCYSHSTLNPTTRNTFDINYNPICCKEGKVSKCYYDNPAFAQDLTIKGTYMPYEQMKTRAFADQLTYQATIINGNGVDMKPYLEDLQANAWTIQEGYSPQLTEKALRVLVVGIIQNYSVTEAPFTVKTEQGEITTEQQYLTADTPVKYQITPNTGFFLDKVTVCDNKSHILFEQESATSFPMPNIPEIHIIAKFTEKSTGITDNVQQNAKINTEGNCITVTTEQPAQLYFISTDGKTDRATTTGGNYVYKTPQPGIYIVRIQIKNQKVIARKVVIDS